MMSSTISVARPLYKAEVFFLCALAFFLPILESPKTLSFIVYLFVWLLGQAMNRELHWRTPDRIEFALLGVAAVSIASTAYSWSPNPASLSAETKGLRDTLTWALIFWLVYRGGYSERAKVAVIYSIMAGVLFGLVWGAWQIYTGQRPNLEFNSAGVVTQSAIYLGIALIAACGRLWSADQFHSLYKRLFWWGCLAVFSAGLVLMGSRGGLLAAFSAILVVVAAFLATKETVGGKKAIAVGLAVVFLGTLAYFAAPRVFQHERMVDKTLVVLGDNSVKHSTSLKLSDQVRFDCWRIGFAQAIQGSNRLLGVGPMKFDKIEVEKLRFDTPLKAYPFRLTHAHNLFLTKWAEEGLLGLIAFLFLLGLLAYRLVTDIRPRDWYWVMAVGALIVPIVSGFFGTPWKHEHAMLASILLGLYFSSAKDRVGARLNGV